MATYLAHIHILPVNPFLHRQPFAIELGFELHQPRDRASSQLKLFVERVA